MGTSHVTSNVTMSGTLAVAGALTAPVSLAVGSTGTALTTIIRGQVTLDPASVGSTTVADQAITITGAAVNDTVIVNPPTTALTAGLLVLQSHVSVANTVTVRLYNTTGAPIDLASGSWTYCLIRS